MDISEVGKFKCRHPWELSRADIFTGLIALQKNVKSVLDIGCGDGFFTKKLTEIKSIENIIGIDTALKSEDCGKDEKVKFFKEFTNIGNMKFDMILFMDVLEHVKEDASFLSSFKDYLNDNGKILITVPAYQKIFSAHDKALKHYRRYNRAKLLDSINKAGFKTLFICDFYASLIFARFLTMQKNSAISSWRFCEKHFFTRLIRFALNIDFFICYLFNLMGIKLKGLSIFAVVEK